MFLLVAPACADKAKPAFDLCLQAEAKGDLPGALKACSDAVGADSNSASGKAAAERLTTLKSQDEASKAGEAARQKAKDTARQGADDAACVMWMLSCTVGRFPDGSERKDQSIRRSTKAACESERGGQPFPCECLCLDRPEPAATNVIAAASAAPEGMAALTGGTYKMGTRKNQVTVVPFFLDLTEVTVDAYSACVQAGGCTADHPGQRFTKGDEGEGAKFSRDSACNYGVKGRGKHPMNCVDWNQATTYCQWNKKRLPTEEEWEWAARGQSLGTEYPWGKWDPSKQLCWAGEASDVGMDKRKSTCPVGTYPKGDAPGGIHDLAGNVSEWTASKSDVTGEDSRIIRGGAWDADIPSLVAADDRFKNPPAARTDSLGFRCASQPTPAGAAP
jgi:formylglycine-generating enzyme required for sulfatase activity